MRCSRFGVAAFALLALASLPLAAQDRLKSMPGYDRYTQMLPKIQGAIKPGVAAAQWADDGKSFDFLRDGKRLRFDLSTKQVGDARPAPRTLLTHAASAARRAAARRRWRGPQTHRARRSYKDRNLYLAAKDGSAERQITTDGSESLRIKYGTASWVYGEELDQTTAMWWSPDGSKLAYYRFDEKPVKDYFLQTDQTTVQGSVMTEGYPKSGTANPIVDVYVYNDRTEQTRRLEVRDGVPFTDAAVGHYVYGISWTKDGSELLIHRTNRRQNIMELAACQPITGVCRTVVREEWLPSWTENHPTMRWLDDGKRFIWESERTGFKNYYLYDLFGQAARHADAASL